MQPMFDGVVHPMQPHAPHAPRFLRIRDRVMLHVLGSFSDRSGAVGVFLVMPLLVKQESPRAGLLHASEEQCFGCPLRARFGDLLSI